MTPELRHCFSITIQVDKPVIVSRSPQTGKRQLIPILGGSVSGQLRGHVHRPFLHLQGIAGG